MNLQDTFSEAWRNIRTNTSRLLTLSVTLGLAVGAIIAVDMQLSLEVVKNAAAYRAAGSNVLVLKAPGAVSGTRCENLAQLPGVRASGAMRPSAAGLTPAALPGAPLKAIAASPGFSKVLNVPSSTRAGLYLSKDAAESVGAEPGEVVSFSSQRARVAGVFEWPSDGRTGDLGYAALMEVPVDGAYDECWVDEWPQTDQMRELIFGALNYSPESTELHPQVAQLNATHGTVSDWHERYLHRFPVPVIWVAAVVAFLVGVGSVLRRRLELASALHAGVNKSSLLVILLVEAGALLFVTWLVCAAATTVAVADSDPFDRSVLLLQALGILCAATAGLLIGVTVGLTVTRERLLFRYFKDR